MLLLHFYLYLSSANNYVLSSIQNKWGLMYESENINYYRISKICYMLFCIKNVLVKNIITQFLFDKIVSLNSHRQAADCESETDEWYTGYMIKLPKLLENVAEI